MAFGFAAQRCIRFAVTLLVLSCVAGARAEDASPPVTQQQPAATASSLPSGQKGGGRRAGGGEGANAAATTPPASEAHRLPPDSTTKQSLALPGRTLNSPATAGSIRLFDDKGDPQADIAYTSYQLDGADRGTRPVTFLFNGGPGASSAWLQFGDAGPWRLSFAGDGAVSAALPGPGPHAGARGGVTGLVLVVPVGPRSHPLVAPGGGGGQ